ncbi:hypothetical protein Bhyg_12036 [Pseudolycoriella hygida]|uniref:Ig-like domain-containing protein n=1 Tax=Pseudolycoriella hygida TaxID=35572 RepID=A0A9Q0MWL8_9DIPT|nr:hypothetical protein Bhyg_12036 [Pseudolycoriella hygida]
MSRFHENSRAQRFANNLSEPKFFSTADLPKDGPEITGEEIQYQIGDVLNLNCTSGKAHPAPLVEWLINDESMSRIGASLSVALRTFRVALSSKRMNLRSDLKRQRLMVARNIGDPYFVSHNVM